MHKVAVGMSGGVDSSVAAYLLKEMGYDVLGLFMKNWEDGNPMCTSSQDFEDASRVCDTLGIPLYSINFAQEYWDRVFTHFIRELEMGYTPNPDILCNREIKFDALFKKARDLGADFLATGHYCQNVEEKLLKGADPAKDQSYFLYAIDRAVLDRVLFPIGHLCKTEVRAIAKKAGLITYAKRDSTGICFIGKRKFKDFIRNYISYQPGNFENLKGKVLGKHDGVAYYTIGQRKGLGIGGAGDAWFVVGKDIQRNVVIVEQGIDHPALYASKLLAKEMTFISEVSLPYRCKAKIRYRQEDQECVIESIDEDHLIVSFDQPQRAITPRQSIVFYDGPICLGGAFIESALYK